MIYAEKQRNTHIQEGHATMLVLTRRLDQAITIGDPFSPDDVIEVTVLEVRGD